MSETVKIWYSAEDWGQEATFDTKRPLTSGYTSRQIPVADWEEFCTARDRYFALRDAMEKRFVPGVAH